MVYIYGIWYRYSDVGGKIYGLSQESLHTFTKKKKQDSRWAHTEATKNFHQANSNVRTYLLTYFGEEKGTNSLSLFSKTNILYITYYTLLTF